MVELVCACQIPRPTYRAWPVIPGRRRSRGWGSNPTWRCPYAAPVPVSRKRKKKSGKTTRSQKPARMDQYRSGTALSEQDPDEFAEALRSWAGYRQQLDTQRTARATRAATDLVADLVAAAAEQPDTNVEDSLCQRLGTLLNEAEQDPIDDRPGPSHMAHALVTAAATAVETALAHDDKWQGSWRVLTAVAGILPYPDNETAADAITRLRNTATGRVLPAPPPGPALTGPALWTRDRYGSRFAVAAPITTTGQPTRWYLWDIDACGHDAFTVHSDFHSTPDAALRDWQAAVGPTAAADTAFAEVDDPWLLAELLPVEQGLMRTGGENEAQFAEYHRSRRLAEVVNHATPRGETPPDRGLDAATAAAEFAAWLRTNDTDRQELPSELDELATELADSWCLNDIDAVFATCSPHRVALCVPHLRNYYLDDFAEQLVALLPAWTRWLAARNATPPDLADRCLPYAQDQPHPQITTDHTGPDYLARITE